LLGLGGCDQRAVHVVCRGHCCFDEGVLPRGGEAFGRGGGGGKLERDCVVMGNERRSLSCLSLCVCCVWSLFVVGLSLFLCIIRLPFSHSSGYGAPLQPYEQHQPYYYGTASAVAGGYYSPTFYNVGW